MPALPTSIPISAGIPSILPATLGWSSSNSNGTLSPLHRRPGDEGLDRERPARFVDGHRHPFEDLEAEDAGPVRLALGLKPGAEIEHREMLVGHGLAEPNVSSATCVSLVATLPGAAAA